MSVALRTMLVFLLRLSNDLLVTCSPRDADKITTNLNQYNQPPSREFNMEPPTYEDLLTAALCIGIICLFV